MDRSAAYTLLCRTGVGPAVTACSAIVLLGGCGSPPKPLPTAPPRASVSVGAAPSVAPVPPGVPSLTPPTGVLPPTALPTYGLPTAVLPTYGQPTTTRPTPTRLTTPPPAPAPACTAGPTGEQILAVVRGRSGVPADQELKINDGPFCAGEWQFATVGLVSDANSEPLLAVTRGRPESLQLVEAGTDVCSDVVERDAPPGIRVLACGS